MWNTYWPWRHHCLAAFWQGEYVDSFLLFREPKVKDEGKEENKEREKNQEKACCLHLRHLIYYFYGSLHSGAARESISFEKIFRYYSLDICSTE